MLLAIRSFQLAVLVFMISGFFLDKWHISKDWNYFKIAKWVFYFAVQHHFSWRLVFMRLLKPGTQKNTEFVCSFPLPVFFLPL